MLLKLLADCIVVLDPSLCTMSIVVVAYHVYINKVDLSHLFRYLIMLLKLLADCIVVLYPSLCNNVHSGSSISCLHQ